MTRSLAPVLLALLLAFATPAAVAQHGPPPGYTDPLVYAQDYATEQAGQAASDPVGYASGKATQENLTAEAEHAAWLACWTAYSQLGAAPPGCELFFTAPVTVDPVVQQGQATLEEVQDDAGALTDEILDAVENTIDDPTTALEQVQRILNAAVGFVVGLIEDVLDLLGLGALGLGDGLLGALDGVLSLLGLSALGLGVATSGLTDALLLAGDGMVLSAQTIGGGFVDAATAVADAATVTASAAGDGLVAVATGLAGAIAAAGQAWLDGVLASIHGLQAGSAAVGHAVVAVASATGAFAASVSNAMADGLQASAGAVGDAVQATGRAVASAAEGVADAVSSFFGGARSKAPTGDVAPGVSLPEQGSKDKSLLDRVLGLL